MALSTGVLLDLPRRTPELGRIRLGEKGERNLPVKLKTFRLTSHSKALLDAASALYGGKVSAWDGAPDEGMWQVTTAASELDILIPGTVGALSQSYEVWAGGVCERRCDGVTETSQEEPRPCVCTMLGQKGPDRDCEVVTRFRVMLPRIPGLGTWMLTTSGYQAAVTLPSTLELLASLSAGQWIPAVLRAEQRSTKARDPKTGRVMTNRFVVPVLDLPGATIGQLAQGAGLIENPLIEATVAPPVTAAARVAERRAQIEARATTSEDAAHVLEGSVVVVTASEPAAAPVSQPGTGAAPTGLCGAMPPKDALGLTLPCSETAGHSKRIHKSEEGGWPA